MEISLSEKRDTKISVTEQEIIDAIVYELIEGIYIPHEVIYFPESKAESLALDVLARVRGRDSGEESG